MATLQDFINQAWNDHGTDAAGVALRLPLGLEAVGDEAGLTALARLAFHVYGLHLGRWADALKFNAALARGPGYRAVGDSGVLLELAAILQDLELDWEYELSSWLGPVGSQLLAGHLRSRVNWAGESLDSLRQTLADYLAEESRSLVGEREAQARFDELDDLKLALDRLDARIDRLARNLHKNS